MFQDHNLRNIVIMNKCYCDNEQMNPYSVYSNTNLSNLINKKKNHHNYIYEKQDTLNQVNRLIVDLKITQLVFKLLETMI